MSKLPDVVVMRRDQNKWPPPEWVSSKRQGETLLDDLQLLLGDMCRDWGFCSALADDILVGESITADDFATRVLVAEGWPEAELPWEWRETMTKAFTARYGSSICSSDYDQRLHS